MMSTLLERWLYSKSGYNKFARNHASTTTSHEEDDDDKDCKSENVKQPTKKSPPPMHLSMPPWSSSYCLSSDSGTLAMGIGQSITAA
jgi:hypothetical protein